MKMNFLYLSGNKYYRLCILLCAFAIFLGGMIYILFRPNEAIFVNWTSTVGLDNWLNIARHKSHTLYLYLPEWIVFSLPNGLWAFAYALLITVIWSGSKSMTKYFWMASIPLLVLGFEILQYTGVIPGTFCLQDITLGGIGLIAGIQVGINMSQLRKVKNP